MPDGRILCAKPRTLTNISTFENLVKEGTITSANADQLASITPLNIKFALDKVRKRFDSQPTDSDSLHCNGNLYEVSKRTVEAGEPEVVAFNGGRTKYVDGVLQDCSTGELFYFLAIDSEDVNTKQIDEGSVIKYDKEYKGVAEVKLYKGNSGHDDAREELIENYLGSKKSKKVIQDSFVKQAAKPIPVKGEIVRYVEVSDVLAVDIR
ncbi:hypothetical protein [Tunicatimonas pelagia]|uniref:hypothetical protein n=1 Tax=Tunicatimonas pelagia TaxID=931531 RepID=UPI00266632D4|nr:hypothetical protein [Tunicatimonas pelagia]WKN41541.1 hypothetical protein P0M28_21125 [Tunicatimonas pelagia]